MEGFQSSVNTLVLHQATYEPGLRGFGTVGILHRTRLRHSGESGCAGGDAFDALGSKADLLDVHSWRQIFRHRLIPFLRASALNDGERRKLAAEFSQKEINVPHRLGGVVRGSRFPRRDLIEPS